MASDWDILVPEATTNKIKNPQFRDNITDGWSDNGNGAYARITTDQWVGPGCLQITADAAATASAFCDTFSLANGETLYVQVRAKLVGSATGSIHIRDTTNASSEGSTALSGTGWQLVQTSWLNDTGGAADVRVNLNNTTADGASTILFDAIQAEIDTSTYTTYCDGDQDGCEWDGEEHNSTSSRSAVTRAGGAWNNLEDDYDFKVNAMTGVGMAPRSTIVQGYSQLPGGQLNNSVRTSRTFILTGTFCDTGIVDYNTLHDKREALISVLHPEAYPPTVEGWQPVRLRYTGADTNKVIAAHYDDGLTAQWVAQSVFGERIPLTFVAPDPNWYEEGESCTHLDLEDTATLYYLAGRLKSTGQWENLGLSNTPTAGGAVYTVCYHDGYVYWGGSWDGIDNNSPAGADCVARYDCVGEDFELVGNASDIGTSYTVWKIKAGPDGDIYLVGDFLNVGDANGDYVVKYDVSAGSFSSLGTPSSDAIGSVCVYDMDWDSNGDLYIVGRFENFAGAGGTVDYVAKWDGTNWSAVGDPNAAGSGHVALYAIAIDEDDNIYVGGSSLNIGNDANADYWAWYNGTTWAAVDDIALNGDVWALVFDEAGDLYVGGTFTNADSVADADCVFKWTGTAVQALDSGANASVRMLAISPSGELWASGLFTSIGGVTADRTAIWTGSAWAHVDIDWPGSPTIRGVAFGRPDPTIPNNYDTYVAISTTGTAYFAGDTTVTNDGTAPAFPTLVIERSGAPVTLLKSLRNWSTGAELWFDYSLLGSEVLTVDLHPSRQTVESSYFGPRPDALLAGSDVGGFSLLPGSNTVTAYSDGTAGESVGVAYLIWRDAYDGVDD